MINLAINGFGRIGRLSLRAALKYPEKLRVVALNTSGKIPPSSWAHLFQYDTAYGQYLQQVTSDAKHLIIDGQKIPLLGEPDPAKLPWKKYQVEVVLESTGVFRDEESARKHLKAGAKKVLISAPAKGDKIPTYLAGINLKNYQGEEIIDGGSCTTNCAAPILKVILEKFGLQKAFLSTVHAYTADQEIQDGSHQDLRRGRAAAVNIVPTSTGATKAVVKAIPELAGKLDGLSIRVPVLVGSLLDLSLLLEKKASVNEINQAFIKAAKTSLKDILSVTDEPLVSSDIIANPHSVIVDLSLTQMIGDDFAKVIAWYDNEWASSQRLIETVIFIGGRHVQSQR